MKKIILALALFCSSAIVVYAVTPIGSGPAVCGGVASVRNYYISNGLKVYTGPYYYFNSVADANTYIAAASYGNRGADLMCTQTGGSGGTGL